MVKFTFPCFVFFTCLEGFIVIIIFFYIFNFYFYFYFFIFFFCILVLPILIQVCVKTFFICLQRVRICLTLSLQRMLNSYDILDGTHVIRMFLIIVCMYLVSLFLLPCTPTPNTYICHNAITSLMSFTNRF